MIGKTLPEYIFIRASIFLLRAIAPVSLLYLPWSLLWQRNLQFSWLTSYAVVESLFFTLVYLPRRHVLQKAAGHPPVLSREKREELFRRCSGYIAGMGYPTGWFTSPAFRKDNVMDWILWALFSTTPDGYSDEWKEEMAQYIITVEQVLGKELETGYNKEARCMRLTLDPVEMLHRPLVWYLIVSFVDHMTFLKLYYLGFRHYNPTSWFRSFPLRAFTFLSRKSVDDRLSYWYRPHRSKTKLPILFLHGIGIGLYPYTPFLSELASQDPDVGILAIEFLPISTRITSPPSSRSTTCSSISHILDSLKLERVVVVSHSYGTVVTAHMFHSEPLSSRIAATLFVDPIPFLLHLPNVAYNFVYRYPRTANEWQLWFFASRDPDISRALSRHFFWTENVLWKEDMKDRSVGVVLSGGDQIVDAEEVRKYLTG
ncbi:hypothetical protein SERLA73DRAFT_95386, partial [Serpula lacrymans var. lacrymans S7.3]